MGDPETWWLNLTNVALGAAVLLGGLAIVFGIVWELLPRLRRRA